MIETQFNLDDIACKEGEYATADFTLATLVDSILPADAAKTLPENPLLVAEALDRHIREEALVGRKSLSIAARIALPKVLDALRELGYAVRQERPGGPWRISWEEGA